MRNLFDRPTPTLPSVEPVLVDFQHWRHEIPDPALIRYGGPFFDRKEAGSALLAMMVGKLRTPVAELQLQLPREALLAGNEGFPEAAVADPLADLEVWDEWETGTRQFPYPGKYGRLAITTQEGKVSSTSSVGVVGEILAGIFAQAGINPSILVRNHRRWPDFIFHDVGRFSFVESKAFTTSPSSGSGIQGRVPDRLLSECLVLALQQLLADPFVKVWGAFAWIRSISPFSIALTFLELDVPDARRRHQGIRVLPEPVLKGIIDRVTSAAVWKLTQEDRNWLDVLLRRKKKNTTREQLETRLRHLARLELQDFLARARLDVSVGASPDILTKELDRQIGLVVVPEKTEGKRYFEAKQKSSTGVLQEVRRVGGSAIYIAELPDSEIAQIDTDWNPDWRTASKPWGMLAGLALWRCGGAVFAVGPPGVTTMRISEAENTTP